MTLRKCSLFITLPLGILLFVLPGCRKENKGAGKNRDSEEVVQIDSIDRQLVEDVKAVKEMFYSMPSPLEVAMILKDAGSPYNPELLNSTGKTSNYVSTRSRALNLGIYTTDLSYSSLYDQTQTTIDYINAAKQMAEGLGILHAIDDNTMNRLEANVNNRDVILNIISETLMNSNSFFEENDRQAISTIVLIGGWIEGLYLATNLINDNPSQQEIDTNELIARVVDQKHALNTIEKLIEQGNANEQLASVGSEIEKLKQIYDQIEITSSKVVPVTDSSTEVTTLKSETTVAMTPEIYRQLKEQINVIRNNFTS